MGVSDTTYFTNINCTGDAYVDDDVTIGGDLVVDGDITPSGTLDVGTFHLNSVAVNATAAEINAAADNSAQNVDGNLRMMVARATYDFAVDGGAIGAIPAGIAIPDNSIICGGFVDVVTTCTTEAADAGTMAIHVEGANDIVTATAVSAGGNIWDAGLHPIVPKANTPESTAIKLTAARDVTFTIAGQAFTAGKFTVFLYYLQGD
jgi:hypothetical protein